jgi:hypothetical protein
MTAPSRTASNIPEPRLCVETLFHDHPPVRFLDIQRSIAPRSTACWPATETTSGHTDRRPRISGTRVNSLTTSSNDGSAVLLLWLSGLLLDTKPRRCCGATTQNASFAPAPRAPLATTTDGLAPCPTIVTEEELIQFLGIPEVSRATEYRHVIEDLKHGRGLPQIHLCGKAMCWADSVTAWLEEHVVCSQ